ncbi:hypothetical protein E2C01_018365 [Portunus trituberculatus]|uniref:Uncharacterized protein n=1 Tax=Portunus trituberculatus TaxID=210409 RepID=A0A5B7DUV1_PORTR|nr:hypothetical protein [Portunus trituberculatus]
MVVVVFGVVVEAFAASVLVLTLFFLVPARQGHHHHHNCCHHHHHHRALLPFASLPSSTAASRVLLHYMSTTVDQMVTCLVQHPFPPQPFTPWRIIWQVSAPVTLHEQLHARPAGVGRATVEGGTRMAAPSCWHRAIATRCRRDLHHCRLT